MRVHPCMWSVSAQTLLLSAATYSTVSQTGPLTTLKQWKVQPFQASSWSFFCQTSRCLSVFGFPLGSPSLDITCTALWVSQPALPVYEKWISPSLHCHGDTQLTHQFCPFKDLHQSCCSDGEVRSVGRDWFHPSLSVYEKASFHIL